MSAPSRDLVEALYQLRVTLTTREQRAALRAVERVAYAPLEPDPIGAEREACARIAEDECDALGPEDDSAARHTALVIAGRIRARGSR